MLADVALRHAIEASASSASTSSTMRLAVASKTLAMRNSFSRSAVRTLGGSPRKTDAIPMRDAGGKVATNCSALAATWWTRS